MDNLKVKILSIAYKSKQTAVLQTYYLQYNLSPIVSLVSFRDLLYVAMWRVGGEGVCFKICERLTNKHVTTLDHAMTTPLI